MLVIPSRDVSEHRDFLKPSLSAAFAAQGVRVVKEGKRAITTLGKLDMVDMPDRLTFALSKSYLDQAAADRTIAAILLPPAVASAGQESARDDWWVLEHASPLHGFWDLHHALLGTDFYPQRSGAPEIHPSAIVSPDAVVEDGVRVGAGSRVEPFAVLKRGTVLGERVTVGPHCVVGKDGFEKLKVDGVYRHMEHAGGVILEDDVVLHSSVHVDRAIWGNTVIGRGTQIDNMCHVGHGCVLGANNLLAPGVILGGVLKVGDDNFFGMNCTVKQNIRIGSRCRLAMGSVILQPLGDGVKIVVAPSMSDAEFLNSLRAQRRRSS